MFKQSALILVLVMTILSSVHAQVLDVCLAVGDQGSFPYINCQDYLEVATLVEEIKERIDVVEQRISNIAFTLETNSSDADWVALVTPTVQEFNDELTTTLGQQEALLIDIEFKDSTIRELLGNTFVDNTFGDLPETIRNSILDIGAVESEAALLLSDLQAISPVVDNVVSASEVALPLPARRIEADTIIGTFDTTYGDMIFDGSNRANFTTDKGRIIIDNISDYVLDGHWVEDSSAEECFEPRDGSNYWGRVKFTFNEGATSFNGTWGYCDDDPTRNWEGSLVTGSKADNYIDKARDACAEFSNGLERNACIFQEGWIYLQSVEDCEGIADQSCVYAARELYNEWYTDQEMIEIAIEYGGLDDPYAGLSVVTCQLNPATDSQGNRAEVSLGACAEVEYASIGPDRTGDSDNDGINNIDDYCPEIAFGDDPSIDKPGCPGTSDNEG